MSDETDELGEFDYDPDEELEYLENQEEDDD